MTRLSILRQIPLYGWVLVAILLAAVAGSVMEVGGRFYVACDFVGGLFLSALRMIVVPLVSASIICAMFGINARDFGRLGAKTLVLYLLTGSLAVLVGLAGINFFRPGEGLGSLAWDAEQVKSSLGATADKGVGSLLEIFERMVPPNVLKAAADGQMLGLIFFCVLFGFFATRLKGGHAQVMNDFWEGLRHVMMHITNWVLLFIPIGAFALVAKAVAVNGLTSFGSVFLFFVTVMVGMLFHFAVVQSLLLAVLGRVNPLRHIRAVSPALLTAFSTSSSSATLPVTLECTRERAGVSERVTGFVLPLGATLNMDGTALYECMAVIFIAQIYGVDLSLAQQLIIVILSLLTSVGVAGVPSASPIAITVILTTVGLPLEGIGFLIITERFLDMFRTAANVYGDATCAVIIAKTEGEKEVLRRGATYSI